MTLKLSLRRYELPLKRPWRSAHGAHPLRSGWLVLARIGGHVGVGDCAPLPEAGTEPLAAAIERLTHWVDRARRDSIDALLAALPTAAFTSSTPAADAALECALLDLEARRRGLALRHLLAAGAADRVAVNAVLGPVSTVSHAALDAVLRAGFRVVKLKVGVAAAAEELAMIDGLLRRLPEDARLRLDANGAWEPETARRFVADLCASRAGGSMIDALEEPLRNPKDRLLAQLQAQAPFAIALDESLATRPRPLEPERLPVRRLVLKPGVIGGLRPTLALARQAAAAGREVVLTSLVESAAGLWATAQLAAATGSRLAHGLATADWLEADLGASPPIVGAEIHLPRLPGSGFEPSAIVF